MILKELLENVKFEDVLDGIQAMYHTEGDGKEESYKQLFEQLKSSAIVPSKTHRTLHVEQIQAFGSKEFVWNASYSVYRRYKQKFSLEFASIEEIANATILEVETDKREEYIAHILREILCRHEYEEDEEKIQEQEMERRQRNDIEYCSVEEILKSLDKEYLEQ